LAAVHRRIGSNAGARGRKKRKNDESVIRRKILTKGGKKRTKEVNQRKGRCEDSIKGRGET